jgi:hypothetical protein
MTFTLVRAHSLGSRHFFGGVRSDSKGCSAGVGMRSAAIVARISTRVQNPMS